MNGIKRKILLENRPDRPRKLDKKKLQEAIDTVIRILDDPSPIEIKTPNGARHLTNIR